MASEQDLPAVRRQLQDWEHRRRRILDHPVANNDLTVLLANTVHLFVCLDGHSGYVDASRFTSYRNALHSDAERLSSALPAPWGAALREHASGSAGKREEDALLSAVEEIRTRLSADRIDLLRHLGVPAAIGPDAAFARLIGGLDGSGTRTKLAAAWDRLSHKRLPDLAEAVDRVVEARWRRARAAGHASPLAATVRDSLLDESAAEEFLTEYLMRAVATHRDLEAMVGEALGCPDDPMNHFAAYLKTLASGHRMPLIPLSACVDTAAQVMQTVFGHNVARTDEEDAILLTLTSSDGLVGVIQVDCVPATGAHPPDVPVNLPIGRALARCRNTGQGRVLTFEAARILMHELGHAVNHVLLEPRRPAPTGLEYLPVERLENLSAWFETWVLHPDFAARVPEPERSGIPLAARIRSTEFLATQLQRAVVAMMDFRVHRTETTVAGAFQQVCEQFGVTGRCHLGDLLPYFGAPVFRVHPGLAGLCYLWSYAFGAEAARLADPRDVLRSCLDPDLPSVRPDIAAIGSV
ncbi:hypothetical protein [Streptomyces sp. NPDC091027]|uniref:hypothetical protein n=1 Tax=Streptomyces sp. NPDC091027 TaxID=3365971 RepID=UPI003802662E